MAIHVVNEARRCLHCKKPMCREGCPIHTPIPDMIQMFLNGKLDEAGQMLFDNNPLSVVCSLVCDHEKQCEGHCVRGIKGEPVHISSIENYIDTSIPYDLMADLVRWQLTESPQWEIETYSVNGSDSQSTTYSMNQRLYVMIPDESTVQQAQDKLAALEETEED